MAELTFKHGRVKVMPGSIYDKFTAAEVEKSQAVFAVILNGMQASGLTQKDIMEIITLANIPHELELNVMHKIGLISGYAMAGGDPAKAMELISDLKRQS